MLTRLIRIQLVVFTVASIVGISMMVINYIQAPTLLGIGRIDVTMQLPHAGGLYQFANVTYRGVQIGKVTAIDVNRQGAIATLSLSSSPPVPADLTAQVRSVSAVGEQYVDLQPKDNAGPFLHDGSVIPVSATAIPKPVGPMMDQLSALIASVPKDKLGGLLDESFQAFNGAGYDLQSLADSTSRIAGDANSIADRTSQLIDDAAPVLESQATSADALRTWSSRLAAVSRQLVSDDPQIRSLLATGPAAAQEVSRLLNQVKPTLPLLLANMSSLGRVAVTYRPGLEQLLVLLPPAAAFYQASAPGQNATGIPLGDFRVSISDPPSCTVGFLPPSSWRSPADTTTIDTPDNMYCKLPQDSPIAVRGARNYPCMDVPGKYAPTVKECKSDKPFQPLATRQHALGPYPLDPNLVAQGVPPDRRVTNNDNIFGPTAGTPPPPGAPEPPPDDAATPAVPNAWHSGDSAPGPAVGVAEYDPESGRVAAPDGSVFTQTDVSSSGPARDWKALVLPGVDSV